MVAIPRHGKRRTGASKDATNISLRQATDAGRRRESSAWAEHLDSRRASVYRTDVPFEGVDRIATKPLTGLEKEKLLAVLQALHGVGGLPLMKVAELVGYSYSRVRHFARRHEVEVMKGRSELLKMRDCSECMSFLLEDYEMIMFSCASVGISYNKSAEEMLIKYMSAYHQVGHDRAKMRNRGEAQETAA